MKDEWLMASALLRRPVPTTANYPHVHQHREAGRRGCAACAPRLETVTQEPERHDCQPAGRGTTGRGWDCPECGTAWYLLVESLHGVQTRTWERA